MSKLSFYWVLGGLDIALISYLALHQGEEHVVSNSLFYLIAPITALIAGHLLLKRMGWSGRRSSVIKWTVLGLVFWLLGEVSTSYYLYIEEDIYPSIIDLFFILGYLSFGRAVLLEAKIFNFSWKQLEKSVSTILSVAFAFVAGIVGYIMILGYDSEESIFSNFVTMSWSLGDLIIGGLAVILVALAWSYRGGDIRREWIWFIGAVVVNLIADTVYSLNPEEITTGSWLSVSLDAFWVSGYFLWAGYFLQINKDIIKIQEKVAIKPDEQNIV